MAKFPTGEIRLKEPLKHTVLQRALMNIITNKEAMREVHRKLGERCNEYVPYKHGELRASMRPYPQSVRWEADYAKYQYLGEVWGPNKPIFKNGEVVGWKSVPLEARRPTGRELGVPGYWKGWRFGYTTPGTAHHWLDKAMENGGLRAYSISVTSVLKRWAKKVRK